MEEFDKLKDINLKLRRFWEKASVWGDKNEIYTARRDIRDITKELKKAKSVLKSMKVKKTSGKRKKNIDLSLESATIPTPKIPFIRSKKDAYQARVARLSWNLELAKAHLEGAMSRKKHAERQLARLKRLI